MAPAAVHHQAHSERQPQSSTAWVVKSLITLSDVPAAGDTPRSVWIAKRLGATQRSMRELLARDEAPG